MFRRFQRWLSLRADAASLVLLLVVLGGGFVSGFFLAGHDDPEDNRLLLPPFLALLVMPMVFGLARKWWKPQEQLDEPLGHVREGVIARAESWGAGTGLNAGAAALVVVGFAAAFLNMGPAVVITACALALVVAAVDYFFMSRLHRPSELRLAAHALELWEPSWWSGILKRRQRFLLHEIEDLAVLVDKELSQLGPSGALCRWIELTDPSGKSWQLPLPMDEEAGDGFLAQLRELIAESRSADPDEEALEELRRMGHRARQKQ